MSAHDRAPWWRSYFDHAFLQLHEPLFDPARSRVEVASMIELLALPVGARVLDLPCGWGRHTLLFAEGGYDAFGADLSLPLLEHAAGDASAAGYARRFAAADVRSLPFRDASFDAVLNVFTSLGLFLDDEQDVLALREARRVLRPGGRLLLESMHRDEVICAYAERDRWTLPDGTEIRMRRRFDPVSGVSHERMRWRTLSGETGEKRHALRLRTATEIDALLTRAGFGERTWYGDWEGGPLRRDSANLIVVAVG